MSRIDSLLKKAALFERLTTSLEEVDLSSFAQAKPPSNLKRFPMGQVGPTGNKPATQPGASQTNTEAIAFSPDDPSNTVYPTGKEPLPNQYVQDLEETIKTSTIKNFEFFQYLLNRYKKEKGILPLIKQDGTMGPQTQKAINEVKINSGKSNMSSVDLYKFLANRYFAIPME